MKTFLYLAAASLALATPSFAQNSPHTPFMAELSVAMLLAKLKNPDGGLMIVAHRGCFAPAPYHNLPSSPENSLTALDNCVKMGVEIMETDVRRTADGALVMIHDNTVDRTTTGQGKVQDLTLAQIKALPLRDYLGGKNAAVTNQFTPTLEEFLTHAKGRILINLDIKAGTYGDDQDRIYEDVSAVVARMGMNDQIIIKTTARPGSPAFASQAPFSSYSYMPMIAAPNKESELVQVVREQAAGAIKPVAYEIPMVSQAVADALVAAARAQNGRLWANSLGDGKIKGVGGDVDALRHPDRVWGHFLRTGITLIQTDEPEALLRFSNSYKAAP